ncbi:hypothetical protein H4W31_006617 [Plantactinospora soyae]|uniref:Uncharacterized protein n=1 Tax=Plantactinospora soyae TaxID=1544732 RepID=A0A927R924_9ACTN|nr:hypothetical protein [Plantactinospora soyae]
MPSTVTTGRNLLPLNTERLKTAMIKLKDGLEC